MSHMRWSLVCALVVCGVLTLAITAATGGERAVPVFSDTGPDAADYGAAEGYPVGSLNDRTLYLVGTYSHFDQVVTVRTVAHAATPWPFRRAAAEPEIAYSFRGGRYTIDDYLHRNPVTGLLIAKDDTILYEHYQYARSDRDRFLSQSMAKTITAMLVGIAVSEGAIKSIDDSVATYLPGLADTEYGKTPIRALLHMSSGVAFSETYDGSDDVATLHRDLFGPFGKSADASVRQFNSRTAPPGTVWHYASVETEILGLVLRAATGAQVADYLRDKIWQRIGTEADASWAIDTHEQEVTYCCFNAVLRDYARLGRLLAHDGAWEGRQIIPRQWVIDATTVRPEESYLAPGRLPRSFGYGFQVWLLPGAERRFALLGVHGQVIFVDPAAKLVMAHTAVYRKPVDFDAIAEAVALWSAVVQQLGGEGGRP
jgi:CubicO group peptidase (beta-lactamase class C family)